MDSELDCRLSRGEDLDHLGERAVRIEFFDDTVERIREIDPLRGKVLTRPKRALVFPASHYVATSERIQQAIEVLELGPLLTGIIMTGYIGAALTAEIAVLALLLVQRVRGDAWLLHEQPVHTAVAAK